MRISDWSSDVCSSDLGHIYYRCHTPGCPPTSVREEAIETAIRTRFLPFAFTDVEVAEMRETLRREYERQSSVAGEQDRASALQLEAIRTRLSRLLDAYLDGTLDKPAFEAKRRTLLLDERSEEHTSELPSLMRISYA